MKLSPNKVLLNHRIKISLIKSIAPEVLKTILVLRDKKDRVLKTGCSKTPIGELDNLQKSKIQRSFLMKS